MTITVTADLFVSADGFARGEHSPGYFGYLGPDLQEWIDDELDRPQHVLMGRRTYAALAGIPAQYRDDGYHRTAALTTTVFSRTLHEAEWPATTVTDRDVVEHVRELKQTADVPLRTMGSLSVVRQLLDACLLDRLRLMVFPLLAGEDGREPAFVAARSADLTLVDHRVLDGRILLVTYAPTGRQAPTAG